MESLWNMALLAFYGLEDLRLDNRTLLPIGVGATTSPDPAAQLLRCAASHTGSETMRPLVMWLRNGVELVANGSKVTITATDEGGSGTVSVLTVTDFQLSDTGIYQCIFTNPGGVQEVITSAPFRLDAGTYQTQGYGENTRACILDEHRQICICRPSLGTRLSLRGRRVWPTALVLAPHDYSGKLSGVARNVFTGGTRADRDTTRSLLRA